MSILSIGKTRGVSGIVSAESISQLERLNRKFRPPLMALFSRRVVNIAEAEDLTQHVFLRPMRGQEFAEDTSASYIFKIATNLIRDRARSSQVRQRFSDSVRHSVNAGIDGMDPFRIVSARETIGTLWASIQVLPEPTQRIFILYRVEEIPKRVIADNFGIHVRTVKNIYYAR